MKCWCNSDAFPRFRAHHLYCSHFTSRPTICSAILAALQTCSGASRGGRTCTSCLATRWWPSSFRGRLPLNLGTHLTGNPGGDTGVYVWNQWVFRHEIFEHGRFPYFTDSIFSLTRDANLSLHNYTTFQDLVAIPLIPPPRGRRHIQRRLPAHDGAHGVLPRFSLRDT